MKFGVHYSLCTMNPLFLANFTKYWNDISYPELMDVVNQAHPDLLLGSYTIARSTETWNADQFLCWLYNHSPVKNEIVVSSEFACESDVNSSLYWRYEYCSEEDEHASSSGMWATVVDLLPASGVFRRDAYSTDFRSAQYLIHRIVHIVSAGGTVMIAVSPRSDGMIDPIAELRLRQIGQWLAVNEEAIFDTKPFITNPSDTIRYTSRKVGKSLIVFAIILHWPVDDRVKLKISPNGHDYSVTLIGWPNPLRWEKNKDNMEVSLPTFTPKTLPCQWAWVLKIQESKLKAKSVFNKRTTTRRYHSTTASPLDKKENAKSEEVHSDAAPQPPIATLDPSITTSEPAQVTTRPSVKKPNIQSKGPVKKGATSSSVPLPKMDEKDEGKTVNVTSKPHLKNVDSKTTIVTDDQAKKPDVTLKPSPKKVDSTNPVPKVEDVKEVNIKSEPSLNKNLTSSNADEEKDEVEKPNITSEPSLDKVSSSSSIPKVDEEEGDEEEDDEGDDEMKSVFSDDSSKRDKVTAIKKPSSQKKEKSEDESGSSNKGDVVDTYKKETQPSRDSGRGTSSKEKKKVIQHAPHKDSDNGKEREKVKGVPGLKNKSKASGTNQKKLNQTSVDYEKVETNPENKNKLSKESKKELDTNKLESYKKDSSNTSEKDSSKGKTNTATEDTEIVQKKHPAVASKNVTEVSMKDEDEDDEEEDDSDDEKTTPIKYIKTRREPNVTRHKETNKVNTEGSASTSLDSIKNHKAQVSPEKKTNKVKENLSSKQKTTESPKMPIEDKFKPADSAHQEDLSATKNNAFPSFDDDKVDEEENDDDDIDLLKLPESSPNIPKPETTVSTPNSKELYHLKDSTSTLKPSTEATEATETTVPSNTTTDDAPDPQLYSLSVPNFCQFWFGRIYCCGAELVPPDFDKLYCKSSSTHGDNQTLKKPKTKSKDKKPVK